MSASDSIGPRRIPSPLPVEARSSKGRRARSPTRIPDQSNVIISNDIIFTESAPTKSSSFYPTPPDRAQSSKIDSSAREIFHPEQESGRAASSSSTQNQNTHTLPPRTINDLLFEGETILATHRSKPTTASPPSSLATSCLNAEESAQTMIKRLDEKKTKLENIKASKNSDINLGEIEKIDLLIFKLKIWLINRRGSKFHLIRLLCEKIPSDNHDFYPLSQIKPLFEKLSSSNNVEEQFNTQSEILNKFEKFFYNGVDFDALALHCATSAASSPDSPFRYKKMTGGFGCVVSLNLVEKISETEEILHPLFVCKPVEAQPGGHKFNPYSDPVTEEDIDNYLQDIIHDRCDQLNNNARSGLDRINAGDQTLFQLMQKASMLGILQDDIGNLTLEQMKAIFIRLGCTGEFATEEQGERVLNYIKALFQAEDIIPGQTVDLVREKIGSDPTQRKLLKSEIEMRNKTLREKAIAEANNMTPPFRGAMGIEVNQVVISNRTLGPKYRTIFEKPLQSRLIKEFPITLRDDNNKNIFEFKGTTMAMEYCPNLGTLLSLYAKTNPDEIDKILFYPEQLETRFILGTIFGFADQNSGNELIVEKQIVMTSQGPRELLRLASIDMGQSNPAEPLSAYNPPFYMDNKYLTTHEFFQNVFNKCKLIDFNQLLNEVSILYEGNDLPLSDYQIKMMIHRWESLKKLSVDFLNEFKKGNSITSDDVKRGFGQILQGQIHGGVDSLFTKKRSHLSLTKKKESTTYKIGDKLYKYYSPS